MWCYVSAHSRSIYWWTFSMSSMLILDYRYWNSPVLVFNYKWQISIGYCYIFNVNTAACLLTSIHLRFCRLTNQTQLGTGNVLFLGLLPLGWQLYLMSSRKRRKCHFFSIYAADADWCYWFSLCFQHFHFLPLLLLLLLWFYISKLNH